MPDPLRARWLTPLLAAAFYAALASALFHRALFEGGRTLGPMDSALVFLPWSAAHPGYRPSNPENADATVAFYPFQVFLEREVRETGRLPLWNPNISCGAPALGNPLYGHFSPTRALLYGMPVERAQVWGAWLRLLLGASFAFGFCRALGASFSGALLGGAAFGFGGYVFLGLPYTTSDAACFVPAVFHGLLFASRRSGAAPLVPSCLAAAASILGGHPETTAIGLLGAGLFALHLAGGAREGLPRRWLGRALRLLLPLGAAPFLAAAALVPWIEYFANSEARLGRPEHSPPSLASSPGDSLAFFACLAALLAAFHRGRRLCSSEGEPRALALLAVGAVLGSSLAGALYFGSAFGMADRIPHLLFPNLRGRPTGEAGFFGTVSYAGSNAAYVGFAPLVLTLLAPLLRPREKTIRFHFVLFVLGISGWIWAPGISHAVRLLPILGESLPHWWAILAVVAAAPLSALALTALRGSPVRRALLLLTSAAFAFSLVRRATVEDLRWVDPFASTPESDVVRFEEPVEGARAATGDVVVARGRVRSELPVHSLEVRLHGPIPIAWVPATRSPSADGGSQDREFAFEARIPVPRCVPGPYRFTALLRTASEGLPQTFRGPTIRLSSPSPPQTLSWVAGALTLLALLAAASGGGLGRLAGPALLAIGVADLFAFGYGYHPTPPAELLYPETKTDEFLQADPDVVGPRRNGRILTERLVYPPNCALVPGYLDVRGYDALRPARAMEAAGFLARPPGLLALRERIHDLVDGWKPSVLLAAKYLLTDLPVEGADFEEAARTEVRIYRNRAFRGLAFLVPRARNVREGIDPARFDPLEEAIVEEEVSLPSPFRSGEVEMILHEHDRVRLRATLDGDGVLVLAENHFPGWRVRVDGRPERLLRVDHAFRGVRLGPGAHDVEFAYRPASFTIGLAISALAAVGLVVVSGSGTAPGSGSARRGQAPFRSLGSETEPDPPGGA